MRRIQINLGPARRLPTVGVRQVRDLLMLVSEVAECRCEATSNRIGYKIEGCSLWVEGDCGRKLGEGVELVENIGLGEEEELVVKNWGWYQGETNLWSQ